MSTKNVKRSNHFGPGPGGPMGIPGEKAKDFKGSIKKLNRYLRSHVVAILLSMVMAVGGVILSINIPNVVGEATDKLVSGVLAGTLYDSIKTIESGFTALAAELRAIPPAELAKAGMDATLGELEQKGLLSPAAFSGFQPEMASALRAQKLGDMLKNQTGKAPETIGDFLEQAAKTSSAAKEGINQIPKKYRADILNASLTERPKVDVAAIGKILLWVLVLLFTSVLLSYLQGFIMAGVAQKISFKMRRQLNEKINRLPLKFYDGTTTGEVLSFITNDVDTVSMTLNQSLAQAISALTMLVGVLVMMVRINIWLTLAALVIIPVSGIMVALLVKRSQKYYARQQEVLGHVNGHIEEVYGGHSIIKLYNAEPQARETFTRHNKGLYESAWKSQFYSGLMMPMMNFVGNLGYVASCVLGGYLTINGQLTVGNITAFIQYIRQLNQPIAQGATIANTLQSTAAAAERIFRFLEQPEESADNKQITQPEHSDTKGLVEFEHVRFGYTDQPVIQDFSARIEPGLKIAIVGPTGAGKTTLVKLLMRFYELNAGRIMLDGQDISQMPREALRAQIGMVLQDTWLYSGTIRENIRYGKLTATDQEVEQAARTAYAHSFIRTLPEQYDFVLNEEAGNVSQGQKQLLTIARAVLADHKVLILDEATSSVDTRTEVLIQQAMARLMEGKTSFIIAHRLSTIRDADLILVMDKGDIIEQGTHEQLLAKNGFYAKLYQSQFENV